MVYNHAPYLKNFFEGVLAQQVDATYELLIGIDECDDDSLEICRSYQQQYPEIIKLITYSNRVGMVNNFIETYNASKGKYIAICEGDDYWTDPLKLQKQFNALEENPKAVLCFTDIEIYDQEAGMFSPNWAQITKQRYTVEEIITSNCISTCTVMFRNFLMPVQEDSFKGLSMIDWPLYVQLLVNGDALYLNQKMAVYRQSLGSTFSKNTVLESLLKKKRAYEYLLTIPALDPFKYTLLKAYYHHVYAIAIRLPQDDARKKVFLKQVIISFSRFNIINPVKAMVRFLFWKKLAVIETL